MHSLHFCVCSITGQRLLQEEGVIAQLQAVQQRFSYLLAEARDEHMARAIDRALIEVS